MAESNVIFCVLSTIYVNERAETDERILQDEKTFATPGYDDIQAIHGNEASVKLLILKAHEAGEDIDEIIYLCSNQSRERVIPPQALRKFDEFPDDRSQAISAEDFFIERIISFCEERGITPPVFNPVGYDPACPADSLLELGQFLEGSHKVNVDTTGGRRDAVILQTLAMQLFKLQGSDKTIGDIVYASFDDQTIQSQESTFEVIDLMSALDSFFRYGRADQLKEFFSSSGSITAETKALAEAMSSFSDAMSLCRVDDIEATVSDIHKRLNDAESSLEARLNAFDLVSKLIRRLDDPDDMTLEESKEELLRRIEELIPSASLSGLDDEELKMALERIQSDYRVNRSEQLFFNRIPTIRRRFVPESGDEDQRILNLIRWCAEHQMIQQALCIYRERISCCLVERGYFDATSTFIGLSASDQKRIIKDLCKDCFLGKEEGDRYALFLNKRRSFWIADDYSLASNDCFSINRDGERYLELLTIIGSYAYLHGVRNSIMHLSAEQDSIAFAFGCAFLEMDPLDEPSMEDLKHIVLSALDCIEEPRPTNIEKWNSLRDEAKAVQEEIRAAHPVEAAFTSASLSDES